jgi:hypothetical protein
LTRPRPCSQVHHKDGIVKAVLFTDAAGGVQGGAGTGKKAGGQ